MDRPDPVILPLLRLRLQILMAVDAAELLGYFRNKLQHSVWNAERRDMIVHFRLLILRIILLIILSDSCEKNNSSFYQTQLSGNGTWSRSVICCCFLPCYQQTPSAGSHAGMISDGRTWRLRTWDSRRGRSSGSGICPKQGKLWHIFYFSSPWVRLRSIWFSLVGLIYIVDDRAV